MFRPRAVLAALLLLPGLLTACTGTDEGVVGLRLAVLTDGGATLQAVGVGSATTVPPVSVTGGVSLDTLPSGRLALTSSGGIESRDVNLANPVPFNTLPFAQPCLVATALSAARDRLLTLSQCGTGAAVNGPQQLALYRTDGTLIWTATLRTFTPPITTTDVPPVRMAVIGNAAVVARPVGGGGSETLRVAVQNAGDTVAVDSTPVPTAPIRDLAPSGGVIYAATDAGVQPLGETGAPDAARTVAAFGPGRVDRLWSSASTGGTGTFLAAWRDPTLSGNGTEPLRVWDGVRASAVTATTLADLRDVTFAPDGFLYALTGTNLTRYDTVLGLAGGNWRPETLIGGLGNARAVTWLVP